MPTRPLLAWAALVWLVALAPTAHAQGDARPEVTSFTLDNGMDVVVIEDHRAPVVTHMVWYRVGAADEPPGKSGIAHFLEHLMFKGTETVGPGEFSEKVALNGGQDNAFTSSDYTAYHQRIAKDRLALIMGLEADRMANLRLSEDDVLTEREVILEERARRIGNSPPAQLGEQIDATLFLAHPYARPVIGWEHEMAQLTRADAIAFYKRFYTPANAILVIAGDVKPDAVRELAEATYGTVTNRAGRAPRVRVREPDQIAARRVILKHDEAGIEQWRRRYLTPSYSTAENHEGHALALLAKILGDGSSSRLYRELVISQKIAVSAGAYYSGTALDYGKFEVYGIPAPGVTMETLEAAIDAIIADVIAEGLTEEEITRAKTTMIADAIYDQDNQSRLARTFGAALTTGLGVEDVLSWPDDIRDIPAEALREVAAKYLREESSVTGLLIRPDGKDNKDGRT